jgi:uncharacterized membrane protein
MHGDRTTFAKDRNIDNRTERLQREKYGGFNIGAAFFGWLVANSVAVLLITLLSALGSAVALTTTEATIVNNAAAISLAAGALLLITMAVAYFAGGYVAGRMSRFDGAKQGLGVWVIGFIITVALGLIGAALGANYNILAQLNLPSIPVDGRTFTGGGLLTLLAITIVSIAAAIGGGKTGENYHHKVDHVADDTSSHHTETSRNHERPNSNTRQETVEETANRRMNR